jgi:hypothetical protein
MRKLLTIVCLLACAGCASQGYRGDEGTYTVYRSRKMTPEGALSDRHLDRPSLVFRDADGSPSLMESYTADRP